MSTMRQFAKSELKKDFDARDFYDVVLFSGAVPLDVLESRVKGYVKTKSSTIELPQVQTLPEPSSSVLTSTNQSIMDIMTFATWCKCCVVPGACFDNSAF